MNKWSASTAERRDRIPTHQVTRINGTPATAVRNHNRHHGMEDDDGGEAGDLIKCSGKSCQSCTGGLIADCVAICCCPCAVVNILALAFLKIPWTIGKRALKMGKNKLRKKSKLRMMMENGGGRVVVMELGMEKRGEMSSESVIEAEELKKSLSGRFGEEEEDEEVWFELYHQAGQLGFGRVSFTGISSSIVKGPN